MDEIKSRGVRREEQREKRKKVLADFRASGLTQDAFARDVGINIGTLRGWIYKERRGANDKGGHFAPVQLRSARPGAVTVRWPQGMEVEITAELDPAGIVGLVRELLTPCLR